MDNCLLFVLGDNSCFMISNDDRTSPSFKSVDDLLIRNAWDRVKHYEGLNALVISITKELDDISLVNDIIENFVNMVCASGGEILVRVHKNNVEEIVKSFDTILKPYDRYKRGFDLEFFVYG